jgi:ABC-type dipeptide/oligopeptide/nickel transport system permease component
MLLSPSISSEGSFDPNYFINFIFGYSNDHETYSRGCRSSKISGRLYTWNVQNHYENTLGLTRTVLVTYGKWMANAFRGNFDKSLITDKPVSQEIKKWFPVTSELLEVLRQDYIRTARAKRLRSFIVVQRHALRNALIPVITMLGLSFGGATRCPCGCLSYVL